VSDTPIIFLGPSLPVARARAIFDADYRPPVRRGDVTAAARERPPLIAIIDGVFMYTLPPSPHEVLRALDEGIPMMGSSSLGALRAAELAPFGMRGIGAIFEKFQSGELVADDEVALVFAPDDHRALSEPMVNVRYALEAAHDAGIVDRAERRALLRVAKEIYFAERTWRAVLRAAVGRVPDATLARLGAFLDGGDFDLKAIDARLLLEAARTFMEERLPAARAPEPRHEVGTPA
jgi:hypothetical protein